MGQNEPFVGRPIDLAAQVKQRDGSMTLLRAKEQIWKDHPTSPGAKELLYNVGDFVREEDALALGLITDKGNVMPNRAVEGDEAHRKPKPSTTTVPRDKAMRGPREAGSKED